MLTSTQVAGFSTKELVEALEQDGSHVAREAALRLRRAYEGTGQWAYSGQRLDPVPRDL